MKKTKIKKYSNALDSEHFKGNTIKNLSIAALVGAVSLGTTAGAEEIPHVLGDDASRELLKNKSVETPILDYLKVNNISIPQTKYQKDENGNLVLDEDGKPVNIGSEPISSPNSAYTITEGTQTNHTFKYQFTDENGNIITKYYNISLLASENDPESVRFGKSENITWKEVSGAGDNTIEVKLPNNTTKYFQYSYDNNDYTVKFGTSPNITWNEVSGAGDNTVQVNLPNDTTKYFQYTYNPNDYTNTVSN